MEKKTISINPKLFDINKAGKSNKSEKKKPKGIIKPNTLKRQLMQKIKSHKKEKSEQHQKAGNKDEDNVDEVKKIGNDSDFDNAMKDLSSIVKSAKDHNKTFKKVKMPPTCVPPLLQSKNDGSTSKSTSTSPVVSMSLPESLSNTSNEVAKPTVIVTTSPEKVAPPYGCLKGGTKPTYKTWKNTNKSAPVAPANKITIVDTEPMDDGKSVGSFTYRQRRLQEIKNKMKAREENKVKVTPCRTPKKLKKTIKNTYTLGKNGKSIKVLIKNSKTRKNNQIEKNIIEQTEAKDIKIYLKNQGLMSAGSNTPMDVMREIFVSSKLSGDIENKNSDVLLDNYFSTDS